MNRLKILRESKGLKQKDIANKMNLSQGNYSRYEQGTLTPTTETLIALSNYYNVSIDYILGLDKTKGDIEIQLDLIIDYIENIKKSLKKDAE
ncbi:helix-turn-helix domain-containing protein [Longicatena caecimuris]|uniref:Transcriptional regulator with XRE-family HTH domain n=1 Tax=Longicatena caecimuris TaxID=1796635 RepID=A0A4R3TM10_9FIRM|nr:helix-turn-helix transcriptional regulator [Longicatena caecimuris]MCR1868968.1 helix-turn-helix domain-containing protein [Longicatena caecimuris]MCR1868977.1 helix-turn-helix domain-containing protein [Longicatena caecimuris]MCU0101458.1 helix-turn-helix domain-containing protein [Longicatena caecimuris]MCU0101467.1 helix-turn-helix domain-containing protein [Longicatena caecimuris]TCU63501.1 transcriptional regulator with XRE-family HTH domain [Longicatena caecimuris]